MSQQKQSPKGLCFFACFPTKWAERIENIKKEQKEAGNSIKKNDLIKNNRIKL